MINRKKTLLLATLSLLLSCSAPIVSVLEQDNQRVRLSQVQRKKNKGRKPVIDTSQVYSKETEKKFREKYTEYEKDENGEDIMNVSLADVNIVAKSKNVPERAGKITLDFKVDVPASLINNKWQIQLIAHGAKLFRLIHFPMQFHEQGILWGR